MFEDELINYLARYNGFEKDYKNLFPSKEKTISLLFKITLPNDLDEEFYRLEKEYLKLLNSRFIYQNPKKLSFKNDIAVFKGYVSKINGDLLINPLTTPIYNPQNLMKEELNDELINYGGLEIRRDLLNEISKNSHDTEYGEFYLLNAHYLPYKNIMHIKMPSNIKTEEDIKLLSNCYMSIFKQAKSLKAKYITIPITNNDEAEIQLAIRTFRLLLSTTTSKMKLIFVSNDDSVIESLNEALDNYA